eukprot:TRINITY_DN14063_c0_g1_i1.p1 TRINITY_DN14063_c0_g1~~TRINITY_DN14063_c0_g1_i1.p1  ORF type:complete len:251 (-),score=4.38 TRINITY_DN14063_c0_g1_i1:19-741(-)
MELPDGPLIRVLFFAVDAFSENLSASSNPSIEQYYKGAQALRIQETCSSLKKAFRRDELWKCIWKGILRDCGLQEVRDGDWYRLSLKHYRMLEWCKKYSDSYPSMDSFHNLNLKVDTLGVGWRSFSLSSTSMGDYWDDTTIESGKWQLLDTNSAEDHHEYESCYKEETPSRQKCTGIKLVLVTIGNNTKVWRGYENDDDGELTAVTKESEVAAKTPTPTIIHEVEGKCLAFGYGIFLCSR